MDSSRLLEIRMRESANIVNRNQQMDSSLRTFIKVAEAVGCGIPAPRADANTMKNVGVCTYIPADETIGGIRAEVCCGQTQFPAPEPQPAKPCTCVEERRYVPDPKCGCRDGR
jgi:hypothetical protein